MIILYRPVRVTNDAQRTALPKGSFMHPNCYMGGPVTYLVPIEAEEETVERHRLCQAVPDVLHRYTTPWTLYTAKETP